MNRRQFLTRATTAAVGAMVMDPDRLLWVPGKTSFFEIRKPMPPHLLVHRLNYKYPWVPLSSGNGLWGVGEYGVTKEFGEVQTSGFADVLVVPTFVVQGR